VRILTELFGGEEIADALAPAWNGGIYYAAQRRSAVTEEAKGSTASIGLLYESKWKMKIRRGRSCGCTRGTAAQILRLVRRKQDEADSDEQVYTTNEGDVLLSQSDTGVFVSEVSAGACAPSCAIAL